MFFIGGFDPKSGEQFFARNRKEADRFEKLWGVSVSNSESQALNEDVTLTKYETTPGDDNKWKVETDFHFLTLDDIVLKDFSQQFPKKLWRYTVTFADYLFSGCAASFFRHAWRFALYFCYPALTLLLFTSISLALAKFVAAYNIPVAFIVGVLAFWVSSNVLGSRYHVLHLMDLWSFSRDFIYQNRKDISGKLDRLADLIVRQSTDNDYDELLLIGHSTGGALILDVAGRAVEQHPEFLDCRGDINVLTVGSTTLKIGLHPKAGWFRERVRKVFASGKIKWMEYQCLTDVINFYNTNPAKLMNIDAVPYIGTIKVRNMLDNKTYQRIKRNFFRVHYQFVFGNSKPYRYDFPAICFGPASLSKRAERPNEFNKHLDGQPAEKIKS